MGPCGMDGVGRTFLSVAVEVGSQVGVVAVQGNPLSPRGEAPPLSQAELHLASQFASWSVYHFDMQHPLEPRLTIWLAKGPSQK
jgi:hypothetical protein